MVETKVENRESTGFPPLPGELMVKRIYRGQLWDVVLCYFIDVDDSNRGNCGQIQHIAKIPFPVKEPDSGNPDFDIFTETTISKPVAEGPSGRIEYSRATREDLIRFIQLLVRFYGGPRNLRENQEKGLKKWLDQVTASNILLVQEKVRLVNVCREVSAK